MPPDHDHDDYLDDEDDDFDERGILKDGRRVRVPLQRDIGSHFQRMRDGHCLHDGQGGKVGHRPGYVFTDDMRANGAKAEAYSLADAETEHAWKGGAQAGDSCRINGKLGVIVRSAQTGELFCQPVARTDSQAARDAVEAAYEAYRREMCDAWRGGSSDAGAPAVAQIPAGASDVMSTHDAREQAYRDYEDYVTNAWRNAR